jgi:hypothetical protein
MRSEDIGRLCRYDQESRQSTHWSRTAETPFGAASTSAKYPQRETFITQQSRSNQ